MLDERGWVKVADFGIAKMAGQATELTMTGSVVGSPHYLSPEQITGEDLDGRSDLFSLGVVLYELLSGKRPFEGETLTSLIYRILHQEPPDPDSGAGEVGGRLNAVVRKLMAKDRGDRYQTAGELVKDLSDIEKSLSSAVLAVPAATFLGPLPAVRQAALTTPLTAGLPSVPPPPPRPATQATAIQPPAQAAAPKGNRTALVLVAAVVGLAVIGGGAFILMNLLGGGKPPVETTTDATDPNATTTPANGSTVTSPSEHSLHGELREPYSRLGKPSGGNGRGTAERIERATPVRRAGGGGDPCRDLPRERYLDTAGAAATGRDDPEPHGGRAFYAGSRHDHHAANHRSAGAAGS